ncbi:MAG: tetratricopeptide repeat protein [Kaiparowitsia implicata GSE-PSE-MK54-09C]|nr:tetratricopeptide repeat protein [Kaiparowitsia implicata GSE-PSE-MK54-09C]
MARSTADVKAEAEYLFGLGAEQLGRREFRAALESFQQALEIYRAIDVREAFPQESRRGEGNTLTGIGVIYYFHLGDYPKALEFLQQALVIHREIGNHAGERTTLDAIKRTVERLYGLGVEQLSSDEFYAALGLFQQALEIYRTVDDRLGEGATLYGIGLSYDRLGNYPKALEFYQQALGTFRESGVREVSPEEIRTQEGTILHNIGLIYDRSGDYQAALEFYQQALDVRREIGDRRTESTTLNNIGGAYESLGDRPKALEFYQQALELFRNIGDRRGEGDTLNNIGTTYLSLGNYLRALESLQQALGIFRESSVREAFPMESRDREGTILHNIGVFYYSLGDYGKALEFYAQALDVRRKSGDRRGEGITLINISTTYLSLGGSSDYLRALESLQQALGIFRESSVREAFPVESRRAEGTILNNIGNVYKSLGDYPKALEFLQQSLVIHRETGELAGQSTTLNNIGGVYKSLGDYPKALEFYQQSLVIYREIGELTGEGTTLSNIGFVLAKQEQNDLAIAFLRASVNVRESIRGDIRGLDTDLQQSFTDTVADTYRTLADLLLARGEILEAQRVLELLKVQELQQFTRSRVTNLETRDYELDPAEKAVIDVHTNLVTFGLKRAECLASVDCSDATLRNLDIEYEQLSDAYTQAVEQLMTQGRQEQEARARRADGQLLQARQELSPEGFAGTAGVLTRNHPGTVLAYPVVLDDKLWVLWGSAGDVVSAIEVPAGRQRIGDAVLRFRQLMTACELGGCDARDIPAVQAVAQELYQYLIPAPLEEELQALQATLPEGQVPNLVIVPDLVTRYIPFAALHDGQQYLIEKYAISTLLSAEQTTADNPLTTLDGTSILGLGLSNPVPEHGFPFPLENVPMELAAIVQTSATESGIFRGETFLNDAFDLDKLRLARHHQVLHLATHGVFDSKADSLSFLMLGVGQPLYIRDLQTAQAYFQNLSLVVLSACETALSDIDQSGLELASIASTFLQARVDTVVASLWQVSDSATSDLMQQFYGSLAQSTPEQRVSVGQALRQAQLAMLYGNEAADATSRASIAIESTGPGAGASDLPRTAHPYYWSPFTIIGNGL